MKRPLLIAMVAVCLPAWAGEVLTPIEAGGVFSVPATSVKELRFSRTVHQRYDFSCGSAAIATLLTHHYQRAVSEQEVFESMFAAGDAEQIRREGFSLLDMKRYLARQGFDSEGYVATLDSLQKSAVPAIALVRENGFLHFVVIKGLRGDRVLVGDPAAGTRAMSRAAFERQWVNRVLFVVKQPAQLTRFNAEEDWRVAPAAPIAGVVGQEAAQSALMRRGPNDH